jgi:tetratricopeptide (TPR) repeat protein
MKKRKRILILMALIALSALLAGCAGEQAKLVTSGDRQMLAGNYQSAAEQYQKAQKREASDKVQLRLATALLKAGRYNEALAELDKASQGLPKADYLRAVCYVGLNDVASAQKSLEQALQGTPDDSHALALLGRLKFLQKQYAQSIEAYKLALTTSSDEAVRTKLYYNLAMAQMLAGQFKQADDSFKQYLVKQNFVTAEDNRTAGAIAYAAGDHDRALRHWQKLSGKEKQQILNAIAEESKAFGELAAAN